MRFLKFFFNFEIFRFFFNFRNFQGYARTGNFTTLAKGRVAETEPIPASNIIESAAIGISDSIGLVANIAANLIGFVALQYFLDAMLGWLGHCVGHGNWSFDLLLSYIFYPFVLVMGVNVGAGFTEYYTVYKGNFLTDGI